MDDENSINRLKVSGYLIGIVFFSYIASYTFNISNINWVPVEADVKSSSISKLDKYGRRGAYTGDYSYNPIIRYRYKPIGSDKYYNGSKIKILFDKGFDSEYEAQIFLDLKIIDNKIKVYYDKENPQKSVVAAELGFLPNVLLVLCIFFAGIFSIGLFQILRRTSPNQTKQS